MKTAPLIVRACFLSALSAAAVVSFGCGSEPESLVPPCGGPFQGQSWWRSFDSFVPALVAVDPEGSIVLGGRAWTADGSTGPDIVKLDAHGSVVWRKSAPDTELEWLSIDTDGDVFVGGHIMGQNASLDGNPLSLSPLLQSFMARLTPAGAITWIHTYEHLEGVANEGVWDGPSLPMMFAADGGVIVVGTKGSVERVDRDSGAITWLTSFDGTGARFALSASVDTNGDIFVGGSFDDSIEVGGLVVKAVAQSDAFLARLSSDGAVLGLESAGTPVLGGNSVVAHPSGGIVLGRPGIPSGFTSYERRDAQGIVMWKQKHEGELTWLDMADDGTIYAAGIDHGVTNGLFIEQFAGKSGASIWRRTFGQGAGFAQLRTLPGCRGSALVLASFAPDGTDFGGGPVHCEAGAAECSIVGISTP